MPQANIEPNMTPQTQPQSIQRAESAGAAGLPSLSNPASMPQLNQPGHMPEQHQEENKENPPQATQNPPTIPTGGVPEGNQEQPAAEGNKNEGGEAKPAEAQDQPAPQ